MFRYFVFLVGWLFAVAVYYRVLFPSANKVINTWGNTLGFGPGPIGLNTLNLVRDVTFIWLPLTMTAGVLFIGFLLAFGLRGTSFRP